ncbi:hypothetical protein [Soonwooa sp.]|uniref:hypothetical protein n=1 Tax=Soonwooa sp. TaxID=1938592 RepID=UPI0028A6EE1E|nr:hypothetical protein [Soonwooa sp.]
MTDLDLLILIKREFKAYLNPPKNKQPSLLQMLGLIRLIRQIIIDDYKLKTQIRHEKRHNEKKAAEQIQ